MTLVSPTSVIRNALNNRADLALSALEARTCHSWKMGLDRDSALARAEDFAGHPSFHLYIREGMGAFVVDLDGNCFIDLSMGLGAQLLGHAVPAIQEAVLAQASRGWHAGLVTEGQLELARHIQAASGVNERVTFCNSGSDATAYAMRAARAFTGRDLIGIFAGSNHGHHDYGIAGEEPSRTRDLTDAGSLFGRPAARRAHRHPGVPQAVADSTLTLAYGHSSVFDQIRRRRRDLAAVIVEPVRALDPSTDHGPWLRELASVCGEAGVLLILDERLTGFRLAYGGAQERFSVMPDLVAYGEVIGGGLPLGAVAGRADILSHMAGREAPGRAAADGGASGNILSVAAGTAALSHLAARRGTLYPALDEKGRVLADAFNAFTAAHGLPAKMKLAGSIFRIQFSRADNAASGYPAAETAFYTLALSKGVLVHASRLGFLSGAHTTGDIAQVVTAFHEALSDVASDGLFELKA
ncbi:MAG: aminotransferase class III-fold pyridoxal phosphate-dependent enzyme [Rhodospirillaceae bacterium]|nr:aminotransferase class III-fold pyridoxal phosphate-dependent enzyme [Rhodospirillaceae bacterium]